MMDRRRFLRNAGMMALTSGAGPLLSEEAGLDGAPAPPGAGALAELRNLVPAAILAPGSAGFEERRRDYNHRIDVTPAVIALCTTPHQVAECIRWARKHQAPLSMRSGGHSYEGFSLGPGMVIDVGLMNSVQVDPVARTAVIGAGARLGQVYRALWQHGFTLPAGACPSVGIAGLTLGGGYGLLSRKWGLTADNLLSVEMVTAGSQVLTTDSHPDLFWACRGAGGGHFGVATSLKFRIHPINEVVVYRVEWPMFQARQVIESWQDWAPFVGDELTCELVLGAGAAVCKSIGQFLGTEDDLRKLIEPLTREGTPRITLRRLSFIDAVSDIAGPEDTRPVYLKAKSDYVRQKLSTDAISTLLRQLGLLTGVASGWVQFDNYGGAINRVPGDATAFVHRAGTLYSIQYNAIWDQPSHAAAPMKWIRDFYVAMRPYVSGYCYVNYCDLDLPDWKMAYYGANFERLTRVKAAYDPGNVFRFPQSIPPARG